MSESRPYITRRQAVRVLGVVGLSALVGAVPQPDEAQAASGFKIIYQLGGGKNPKKQVKRVGKGKALKVSKLKKPTRSGYKFKAWFKNEALTVKAKKVFGKPKPSKRTLYAKWKPVKYKVTYKLKGGYSSVPFKRKRTVVTPEMRLPSPQRSGYAFGGWFSNKKLTKRVKAIAPGKAGNITLYAKWNRAAYWDAYLNNRISDINALRGELQQGDAFLFITDMHMHMNAMYSPALVEQVMRRTSLRMTVFGGDAIDFSASADEALSELALVRKALDFGTMLYVHGNHDNNDEHADWAPLTDEQVGLMMGVSLNPDAGNMLCYVHDYEPQRIRYIVLDTGHPDTYVMKEAQVAWLKGRVLDLPAGEDWTVVVLQHQFFHPLSYGGTKTSPRFDPNGTIVAGALDEIYDEAEAKGVHIAGVISGHCHCDASWRSSKGYWAVSSMCDTNEKLAREDDLYGARKRGTVAEQSFDVVFIDTARRAMRFVRIGAGPSREFSY